MNSIVRKMQVSTTEDDNEIVFTRLFDAPRALVYKVFTDPRHLA
ncbi:hypothetical protein [Pseudomonas cavernicola]|nr:hypothetical protein [Pseudomonas cavernicola]